MNKKKLGLLLIGVTMVVFLFLATRDHKKEYYSLDELNDMSDEEMYDLFVERGMRIHQDFLDNFTKEERIEMFREQLDHILETGYPRVLSYIAHKEMGEDIMRIYDELIMRR